MSSLAWRDVDDDQLWVTFSKYEKFHHTQICEWSLLFSRQTWNKSFVSFWFISRFHRQRPNALRRESSVMSSCKSETRSNYVAFLKHVVKWKMRRRWEWEIMYFVSWTSKPSQQKKHAHNEAKNFSIYHLKLEWNFFLLSLSLSIQLSRPRRSGERWYNFFFCVSSLQTDLSFHIPSF